MPLSDKTAVAGRVVQRGTHELEIMLTQGMNRQIRRMIFKLGNYVTGLIRVKMGKVDLDQLKPGEFRWITREEIL